MLTTVGNIYTEGKHKYKLNGNDVYIGRPSLFGNPFEIGKNGSREEVIQMYQSWFNTRIKHDKAFREQVLGLKGKHLLCYCKPQACHGDIIKAWLNNQ